MRLAISMGDPAGIGPEVILKSLIAEDDSTGFVPVVFGSPDVLRRDANLLPDADAESVRRRLRTVASVDQLPASSDPSEAPIWVVDVTDDLDVAGIEPGSPHESAAHLQLRAFERAVDAVESGSAAALVTAPWTKRLFRRIDREPTGHTELLGDRFADATPTMMLAGPRLRVSLATAHVPLRRVGDQLDGDTLERTIRTTATSLQSRFGIASPSVAVCGLNPHAGEQGAIGNEERNWIAPLVDQLDDALPDTTLTGPLPSDTLFMRFRQGDIPFDAVVSMYHDQGLIPLKLLHFGESANITLGLPIIRTSVDHGTAYDIAGKGVADAGSMRYALTIAGEMAERADTD